MPLYEYECQNGHRSEASRPIDGRDIDNICPVCGQLARRVMSVFTHAIDWNSVMRKIKSEPAPNDSGYHPKWDS